MTSGDEFEDWHRLERSEQEEIMDVETAYQDFLDIHPTENILLGLKRVECHGDWNTRVGCSFWDISRFKRSKNL